MNFIQRLRFFLIGFVPGLIILFFIIKQNGCSSPNELKMLELTHQHINVSNKVNCKLKCLGMNEALFKVNLRLFKINYSLSTVRQKPYGLYYLQGIDDLENRYEMVAEDRDTTTFVDDIKLLKFSKKCNCDSVNL